MDQARIAELTSNTEALRALVGRRVRYLGREYEISDLLLEDGLMILSSHEHSETQDDAYGRAHRLVPRQQKLKIRDAQGCPTHVWEDMIFLDGPVAG
ncbi:MAG: hypothetical protein D6678_04020 [Zetaproteobacteria bacterium]|nr:MAG: hypothetical protein D6678_04020 [Zetaproteobacteria bacterium]